MKKIDDKQTFLSQRDMPFVEALENYKKEGLAAFHTPGHKLGIAAPTTLKKWMGPALPYDLGVMYALDDLHEPEGALKDAQDLAAQLYGAEQTWFSINGTTALIETMIMGTVGPGDTIIIPREAHRSVMGGLLLSGARPVYLEGRFDERWGVPLGTTVAEVKATLAAHPEAKALVLVNPNYYGIAIDLQAIVEVAHEQGVIVLVDEAHGAHLPFGKALPASGLACGADVVAQSTHKLIGSLTQTSMLHCQGSLVNRRRLTQVHQVLQSTSPNYILLASLDMARQQMATEGATLVSHAERLAHKLRQSLQVIPGIAVPDKADFNHIYEYDYTKVLIDFKELGLTGSEAELLLRKEGIEVELVQGYHVLVLITIGDTEASINRLIGAVQQIAHMTVAVKGEPVTNAVEDVALNSTKLPVPEVVLTPREGFYQPMTTIPLTEAIGHVAGETISYYPPGIPFLAVGERITPAVVEYIRERQALGYVPNGCADKSLTNIQVIDDIR
ncbi:aminotransferase class I/II-fold pyridoxal phosphate-dependent enzyme [Veillonella sp. R32]|uniref:aminotransferase class I/II-fold pyridoxal phosphate-dependent enzyme n=1 Tax=Veillonella sp. R32 TaxID=2021312 RepID=UPI001389BF95|nr:aminotransferase class I/II-fold pyridoxal phosphate-dependent enzyme [Veillonella sp. R32]KAF1680665.1 arginine 2-monooxygenase [Veillonella sp. R32]